MPAAGQGTNVCSSFFFVCVCVCDFLPHLPAEPVEARQLHVVYERAPVVPGVLALAVDPGQSHVLTGGKEKEKKRKRKIQGHNPAGLLKLTSVSKLTKTNIVTFAWRSNDRFHCTFAAEFATLAQV